MISSNKKGVSHGHYTYSMVTIPARFIGYCLLPRPRRFSRVGLHSPQGNRLCPHPSPARPVLVNHDSYGRIIPGYGAEGYYPALLDSHMGKVWIWASIALMLFVFIDMGVFNETRYKQLRRLVGLPYMQSGKELPAEPSCSPEEVAELLKKTGVTGPVIVGYFIPTFVLWLMIFKPF
jgi:hypothetical protein